MVRTAIWQSRSNETYPAPVQIFDEHRVYFSTDTLPCLRACARSSGSHRSGRAPLLGSNRSTDASRVIGDGQDSREIAAPGESRSPRGYSTYRYRSGLGSGTSPRRKLRCRDQSDAVFHYPFSGESRWRKIPRGWKCRASFALNSSYCEPGYCATVNPPLYNTELLLLYSFIRSLRNTLSPPDVVISSVLTEDLFQN